MLNLTLASPDLNRHQKADRDAADWLPSDNRCWFAARIVEVRRKYALTIDEREVRALEPLLSTCLSTQLVPADCAAEDIDDRSFFRGWRLILLNRRNGPASE